MFVRKPEGRGPLGTSRVIWEDNIRKTPRERGWESVDYIHRGQDREK
jgi:hypothetical protein